MYGSTRIKTSSKNSAFDNNDVKLSSSNIPIELKCDTLHVCYEWVGRSFAMLISSIMRWYDKLGEAMIDIQDL